MDILHEKDLTLFVKNIRLIWPGFKKIFNFLKS